MKLYKLTDQNNMTRNNTLWGENVSHSAPGTGELCTAGWIHAYESAEMAVIMNPYHADIINPKLWEAEGDIGINDHGLKCGVKRLTTLREIPLPIISAVQHVAFAIYCAQCVYTNDGWNIWAEAWLSGSNRDEATAAAAARAVAAVRAIAAALAVGAANAAYSTARAVAAANADAAANAAYSACTAARAVAVTCANDATYAAARAAYSACTAATSLLPFQRIITLALAVI